MTDPLEQFVDHYYRRRPVNATFTGMHEYDQLLPDWSLSGIATIDDEMRQIVTSLNARYPQPETARAYRDNIDLLDAELARAFCEIQLSENASAHGPRGNPALWTGEAVFSVIALMIREYAPLEDRLHAATARMNAMSVFFEQARESMGSQPIPAAWIAKALRDCAGADALFTRGVERWLSSGSRQTKFDSGVRAAAANAAQAFGDFAG